MWQKWIQLLFANIGHWHASTCSLMLWRRITMLTMERSVLSQHLSFYVNLITETCVLLELGVLANLSFFFWVGGCAIQVQIDFCRFTLLLIIGWRKAANCLCWSARIGLLLQQFAKHGSFCHDLEQTTACQQVGCGLRPILDPHFGE